MRVGELLLQRGWVDWETLALAIGDHPASGMRLCSFLVQRGALSFDQASRALGEHHRSAAALQRHLEGRDPDLASLLPDTVAKKLAALPIGRLGNGSLIVCVRDPSPAVRAALSRSLREELVLAVAPSYYLERLIDAAYAPRELDADELEETTDDEPGIDVPIDVEEPADDFAIDVEVAAPSPPKPKKRALSVVIPVMAAPPSVGQKRDSLDATLVAFREIDAPNWLFDVAMEYIAKHWTASLLFGLTGKRAIGTRGHGARITPTVVKTCVVDLDDIAIVEQARIEKRLVEQVPGEPGGEYEMLARLLGTRSPLAVPILRGTEVSHVLLLADPIGAEREDALVDLGLLVESIGEALARM